MVPTVEMGCAVGPPFPSGPSISSQTVTWDEGSPATCRQSSYKAQILDQAPCASFARELKRNDVGTPPMTLAGPSLRERR